MEVEEFKVSKYKKGSNPFELQFDIRSIDINGAESLIDVVKNINDTNYNLFYGIC